MVVFPTAVDATDAVYVLQLREMRGESRALNHLILIGIFEAREAEDRTHGPCPAPRGAPQGAAQIAIAWFARNQEMYGEALKEAVGDNPR